MAVSVDPCSVIPTEVEEPYAYSRMPLDRNRPVIFVRMAMRPKQLQIPRPPTSCKSQDRPTGFHCFRVSNAFQETIMIIHPHNLERLLDNDICSHRYR